MVDHGPDPSETPLRSLPRLAEPAPPMTPAERRRAWFDMIFPDHGVFRAIYPHRHRVADGVWRSAQPTPRHLEQFAAMGIRTVMNLRGGSEDSGSYLLERETCQRLGLTLVDFPIRSRIALKRPTLLAALDIWDQLETPLVMHCKAGADRTGFMATLYLWQRAGVPLRDAMRHLSWRYGHFRHARTGVVDHFFESYLKAEARSGIGFRDWLENEYDPEVLEASFKESRLASLLVDRILRRE